MTGADALLLRSAARNNAAWCDAVCRTHGLDPVWDEGMWSSPVRTPTFYPDAVTLRTDVDPAVALAAVDLTSPGCSIKDSFDTLDLSGAGFTSLIEARWIHRRPGSAATTEGLTAEILHTAADLGVWAAAWHGAPTPPPDIFRPALLADPEIRMVTVRRGETGVVVGGCALNRAAGVVGLSNVFVSDPDRSDPSGGDPDRSAPDRGVRIWSACIAIAAREFPGLDLLGYEADGDLESALAAGFRAIGPLRVWLRSR